MESWFLQKHTGGSVCLQRSPETDFYCHIGKTGDSLRFSACPGAVRVLFVCSGTLRDGEAILEARTVYIPEPEAPLCLDVAADCLLLELFRHNGCCTEAALPYRLDYEDALTYTEDCKSAKTTSRMLIPARIVPDFAMGSVQTAGEDMIAPHTHPDVDQYFYGLEENNCILTVDGKEYPFGGHHLVHIPLGSLHGVRLEQQHTCHYLWLDSLLNDAALAYMDEAHQLQGGAL